MTTTAPTTCGGCGFDITDFYVCPRCGWEAPDAPRNNGQRRDDTAKAGHGLDRLAKLEGATATTEQLKNLQPPEPLIDGYLQRNSLAVIYGQSGDNKTFVAVDWALSVATGSWWHGHAVHAGPVVYVVAEGAAGLGVRVRAWQAHNRVLAVDRHNPVHWVTIPVNLTQQGWADAFADYCQARKPVLVVVDTLARCMVGGDENSARDMGLVVDTLDQVRRATQACVAAVHHAGKDTSRGARGSSALKAALDTEVEVSVSGGVTTVKATKQKDAKLPPAMRLHLTPVGDSCVLVPSDSAEDAELPEKIAEALATLMGIEVPGGVSTTTWLKASDMSERSFYRARKRLLDDQLVDNIGTDKAPKYVTRKPTS